MDTPVMLHMNNVGKQFLTPSGTLTILDAVSCSIYQGEKIAIIGPSGSGKSTLLSLIGLLDTPSWGEVSIAGRNITTMTENELARVRNENIGFVFQSFELIAPFTVTENVEAPQEIGKKGVDQAAVAEVLAAVAMTHRAQALPYTLSGGEKQRVAIARALINRPALLLADEPTGSLDRATGEKVMAVLLNTVASYNTTLIIITHDESISAVMDRVFEIRDRSLYERK